MNIKASGTLIFLMICCLLNAQKGKVQTAWRALSDYEETLKEGKPNLSYLNKAKEAIDMALQNEETKNKGKTHAYKLRVSYAQFQYDLNEQMKKLESSISDKNERMLTAYGNTSLVDFETATEELNKIKDLDPKFLETIQQGLKTGSSAMDEDELKLAQAAQQMKIESGNIALGKHKAKKYEEAAAYFYKTGIMNSILYQVKDTANFYNACVSASKANNPEMILEYNKKMIDAKISSPYNYQAIYVALLNKKDSTGAIETLKKGRELFPDDMELLSEETSLYLSMGKHQEALNNLKVSLQKDPSNPLFYFVTGMIYDNMANPKDKNTNKELEKPSNFEELFRLAETNYLKAIELKPTNKEYLFNSYFNLGAMYNNYGGMLGSAKGGKISDAAAIKEKEAKAQEYYRKAIPYLEKALGIRSDDDQAITALRKLYMLTGNEAKAKEMNEKLKSGK